MNKKGASKGKVLVIALDEEPHTALTDKQGFLLCFDTFKQIAEYCSENNINIDNILVDELDVETGKAETFSFDDIEEVEF